MFMASKNYQGSKDVFSEFSKKAMARTYTDSLRIKVKFPISKAFALSQEVCAVAELLACSDFKTEQYWAVTNKI